MDRALLEGYLSERVSLAEIGRRVGRHESTVAYWVQKYDLQAAHRDRHAARGRVERGRLAALVETEMSAGEIALAVGVSMPTVRRWLREYGLVTRWSARRTASREGRATWSSAVRVTA